jgi:hypothetical protein
MQEACLLLVSCLAYSSTLKMGAMRSSETSMVSTQLNDITTQNIVLLVTAMRIQNHSLYCDMTPESRNSGARLGVHC